MSQKPYKPHYDYLKGRWTQRKLELNKTLWERHRESLEWLHTRSRQAMAGSMASLLILTQPVTASIVAENFPKAETPVEHVVVRGKSQFISSLKANLPESVQPLTPEQEKMILITLRDQFNLPVKVEMKGIRLNRNYGLIGAEQHLTRYPGDTMETHFSSPEEQKYYSSGMAPGRGAWRYFADSRESMTEKDVLREKYYMAVPTFLSPGWNENVKKQYEFFKFRKMLVVNPENGKAMVVVIGDSGPAEFTGKHCGGSPEVMSYLERVDGSARGPVLYFFIDDPEDKIPLGPIEI